MNDMADVCYWLLYFKGCGIAYGRAVLVESVDLDSERSGILGQLDVEIEIVEGELSRGFWF